MKERGEKRILGAGVPGPLVLEGIPRRLLSVEEAAAYVGLSPRTLYNRSGPKAKDPFPVKPKRIGRCLRFDLLDLNRYLDSL